MFVDIFDKDNNKIDTLEVNDDNMDIDFWNNSLENIYSKLNYEIAGILIEKGFFHFKIKGNNYLANYINDLIKYNTKYENEFVKDIIKGMERTYKKSE